MYVNCTPCLAFCIQCPEVVAVVIWRGAALSVPGAQHDSRRRLDRRPQPQEEGKSHLVEHPVNGCNTRQYRFLQKRLRESRVGYPPTAAASFSQKCVLQSKHIACSVFIRYESHNFTLLTTPKWSVIISCLHCIIIKISPSLLSDDVRPRADTGLGQGVHAVAGLPLPPRGPQRPHLQVRHGRRLQDNRRQGIHLQGTRTR